MTKYFPILLSILLVSVCGCAHVDRGPYRNVALNPEDTQGEAKTYPHATSNSEYKDMACFAACNVLDGKRDNKGHGWKHPSWGPHKRTDLWLKIEFGRAVEIDRVDLYLRADFPHDDHWHSGVIEFSDGSRVPFKMVETADKQTVTFPKRRVSWLRFTDLVEDEPLGWCGFTEVEVWGR